MCSFGYLNLNLRIKSFDSWSDSSIRRTTVVPITSSLLEARIGVRGEIEKRGSEEGVGSDSRRKG